MSRDSWRWGVTAWLALRVITSLSAWLSVRFLPPGPTVMVAGYRPPALSGAAEALAGPWLRADALWYLKLAGQGYGTAPGDYAFFPLFPLLVRVLTLPVAGGELYAALLVSGLASLAGLVLLFALVEHLGGVRAARAAVAGLALFPASFFLVAPYAEPLLLAAGSGALLAAARRRPVPAFFLGAAAALARPFGVLLAIPLAALLRGRGRLGAAGPVAGLGAWVVWVGIRTGDPLAPLRVQSLWQREVAFPGATLLSGVREWLRWLPTEIGPFFLIDLAAAVFGVFLVAGTIILLRRGGRAPLEAWGIGVYGALVVLVPLSFPFPPRPLLSLPRFVLALFPLFGAVALVPRRLAVVMAAASAAGLGGLTALYVAARPIF